MLNPTFLRLVDEMADLHHRKNADYARDDNPYSNFEFAAAIAAEFTDPVDRVFATMLGIKLARLGQLLGAGKVPNNESADDTMRDLTVYAAIWTAWRRDQAAAGQAVA